MKAVRNINLAFGEGISFHCLGEMIHVLSDINGNENWIPSDGLKEGRDYEIVRYMMNTNTGSVDTEESWVEDWKSMPKELWGGEDFEDADLVYVERNVEGEPGYNPDYGEWRPEDED